MTIVNRACTLLGEIPAMVNMDSQHANRKGPRPGRDETVRALEFLTTSTDRAILNSAGREAGDRRR